MNTVGKVILFGAGASAEESENGKVPLTSELFNTLREEGYDSWNSLEDEWVKEFQNIELGLEKFLQASMKKFNKGKHSKQCRIDFQKLADDDRLRKWRDLQWEMAHYFYTKHKLKKYSLYENLLEKIKPFIMDYGIATLNYDTLLFQALERIKVIGPRSSMNLPLPICLPHGTCLFYSDSPNLIKNDSGYFLRAREIAGNPFDMLEDGKNVQIKAFTNPTEFQEKREKYFFPPIMCYIEPEKWVPIGKSFIQREQKKWLNWIESATHILIIGVKINLTDAHIWSPLKDTFARILYVSGPKAKSDFDRWSKANGRCSSDTSLSTYWSDSVPEIYHFLEN